MFYKQFSKISNSLNNDFIKKFDFWLATLPRHRQKNITNTNAWFKKLHG